MSDAKTNLPLPGVNVVILRTFSGTATDSLGNFSLNINTGKYTIRFSRVGYEPASRELSVTPGMRIPSMNISLKPTAYLAEEVTISAERQTASPGIHKIEEKNLQYIPTVYSDVLWSVTILPGVTSDNELTSANNPDLSKDETQRGKCGKFV